MEKILCGKIPKSNNKKRKLLFLLFSQLCWPIAEKTPLRPSPPPIYFGLNGLGKQKGLIKMIMDRLSYGAIYYLPFLHLFLPFPLSQILKNICSRFPFLLLVQFCINSNEIAHKNNASNCNLSSGSIFLHFLPFPMFQPNFLLDCFINCNAFMDLDRDRIESKCIMIK